MDVHKSSDPERTVMVAMSGGVDSSAAALLLLEEGYRVVGVTMCLGLKGTGRGGPPSCCGPEAVEDARRVCEKLGVKHHVLDFSREIEALVIQPFVREYMQGKTPNPCIWCNQFLKFGKLLSIAQSLRCRYLATGHYARIEERDGIHRLLKPKDVKKDQTYFLYRLQREKLPFVLFPLAEHTKEEVREKVKKAGLHIHNKRQSQDICFIPEGDYRHLIRSRVSTSAPGPIVDRNGKVLGEHQGVSFYTVGQRKGLRLPGPQPWYVIAIRSRVNQVVVGSREDLLASGLRAGQVNLLVDALPQKAFAKLRSSHRETLCRAEYDGEKLEVRFDHKQEFVNPGQSVVLYDKKEVLGGGIIEKTFL